MNKSFHTCDAAIDYYVRTVRLLKQYRAILIITHTATVFIAIKSPYKTYIPTILGEISKTVIKHDMPYFRSHAKSSSDNSTLSVNTKRTFPL